MGKNDDEMTRGGFGKEQIAAAAAAAAAALLPPPLLIGNWRQLSIAVH